VAFLVGSSSAPRPHGPSRALIDAIVEFERCNPRVGCPRIAQEIARAFGIEIDKDIVRRVLAKHYRPEAGTDGPSWLSLIGHMKDSLWSVDLFRCESILLRSHWVMLVMDVFTRRIIGFGDLGCNVMFIARPPREWLFLGWREQIAIFLSRGRAKHRSGNTWMLVS
jgi:putative transposase